MRAHGPLETLHRVMLGKAVFSAVFRVLKKNYQLYQNKNGTSGKENEFYIRYGVVPPNLVKQECSVNELRK